MNIETEIKKVIEKGIKCGWGENVFIGEIIDVAKKYGRAEYAKGHEKGYNKGYDEGYDIGIEDGKIKPIRENY